MLPESTFSWCTTTSTLVLFYGIHSCSISYNILGVLFGEGGGAVYSGKEATFLDSVEKGIESVESSLQFLISKFIPSSSSSNLDAIPGE